VPQQANNLLLKLHGWVSGQDENFVTEAFAHLLRHLLEHDPGCAARMLSNLTQGKVAASEWQTGLTEINTQVTVDKKRPDIEISAPGLLIYVEVKVESFLGSEQLGHYRKRLDASRVGRTYLVLLTQYEEQASENQQPDSVVRWYEVAHWLEDALRSGFVVQPSSLFLGEQFLQFMRGRRLTLDHVERELTVGARSLVSLHAMVGKGLIGASLNSFKIEMRSDWWGYNVELMRYFVGVYIKEASLLRFRTYGQAVDAAKAESLGCGKTWRKGTHVRWENVVDLDSKQIGFFEMSTSDQMRFIEGFVKESLELVELIAVQAGDQEVNLLEEDMP
jgi:hypothetical protein